MIKRPERKILDRVPGDAKLTPDERGWIPLSAREQAYRGWTLDDLWQSVCWGEMKYAHVNPKTVVFFERAEDKDKYRTKATRHQIQVWKDAERCLAFDTGMPYWYDVLETEKRQERMLSERGVDCGAGWESFWQGVCCVIVGVLNVVWTAICVLCWIFLLRNATQWFFGTGAYGKKCGCE